MAATVYIIYLSMQATSINTTAMNIKLDKGARRHVNNTAEMYIIMKAILKREHKVDRNREHLWTICFDSAKKILNIELVSMGSIKTTVVEPMEVFSIPLQKRAVSLVVIHNHPSGRLVPSAADKDITDRLIQCGLMLQVPVIDHIIISESSYYSFAESGLLAQLEESTKYVPDFILKERIKKQVSKAGKEGEQRGKIKGVKEGENKKAIAMAKAMKKKGYLEKEIMELTGLSKKQINVIK